MGVACAAGSGRVVNVHELSIACELVKSAAAEATRHGAARVVGVDLVLGALTGVEPDALAFCFPVAAAGTPCDGAELRIEIEPAKGRCADCAATSEINSLMSPCPRCGAWPIGLEGGREMRLRSVEVT
jgi:hydrogenase nickel incorporation protein HypA/HybF